MRAFCSMAFLTFLLSASPALAQSHFDGYGWTDRIPLGDLGTIGEPESTYEVQEQVLTCRYEEAREVCPFGYGPLPTRLNATEMRQAREALVDLARRNFMERRMRFTSRFIRHADGQYEVTLSATRVPADLPVRYQPLTGRGRTVLAALRDALRQPTLHIEFRPLLVFAPFR